MWSSKMMLLIASMLVSFSMKENSVSLINQVNNEYCIWEIPRTHLNSVETYVKAPLVKKAKRKANRKSDQLTKESYELKMNSPSLQDSIFEYMKTRLLVPTAAFALAVHESGNFMSKLWREGNNMFGISYASKVGADFKVWSTGDNHWKAGWNDWRKGIDAFAAWEQRKGIKATTPDEYFNELRRIGYARDRLHGAKLRNHHKKLFI